MRIIRSIFIWLISILFILVLTGTFVVRHFNHRCIPAYEGELQLQGITEEVVVYRDSFAIPHIYAKNEKDLYTAVGYVLAQDRLWQMDLMRRATLGTLSEIFGDDFIETDLMLRSLRITEKSEMVQSKTDKKIIDCIQAFANGVNQYIEENSKKLPVEFLILGYKPQKWEPIHSFNLIGYMAWDLTSGWHAEIVIHKLSKILPEDKLKLIIPDLNLQKSYIFPNVDLEKQTIVSLTEIYNSSKKLDDLGVNIFCGSNNWVVSAEKSKTGKPVLANDMHLGLFAPGIWCQMHQVIEDQLNVTGVVLPGQPFIISGHNDSIAWGMTNVMLDDIDFYLETLNDDSSKYLINGEWKDLIIKTENIKSKSGNSFEKIIKFTHRGPIISQFKDISSEAISMKWIGNEYSNELRSVYLLNRADNWDDFKEAMNTFNSTSQNIVYADLKNNIGLYCCAGIPIREGNGIFIAPGDTDKYDWQGLVPFNERPHAFNPETGYLISANNNTAQDYPYHISHWFHPPVRFDRIKELIDSIDKLSIEDHIMIQTDFKSNYAIRMNQEFLNSLKSVDDLSNKEKEVLSILEEWDGVYSVQSLAPTIFETLHMVFIRNIVLDEMGEELYKDFLKEKTFYWSAAINIFKNQNSSWYDNLNTPEKVENYRDILKTSYNETIEMLNKKYRKNIENWKWGKVHQLVLKHPMGTVKILDKLFNLNYGSFEVGGSYHTVAPYSFSFNNLFDVIHGASERHIYSLADWDESLTVIPTGNPGIPSSKYYCNQSELYVNNLYHSDYISRSKIENSYKYKIIFIP